MTIPAAVKEGQPAYGWCDQFKKSVPAPTDEAWTAGMVAVQDATNGGYKLGDADNIVTIGTGIVAQDKPTADPMGIIYLAPAVVYSKYIGVGALKNFTPVATIAATAGRFGAGTDANAFAQIEGKAGQGGGGLVNDFTDIAQNDIIKLRLIK